MRRLLFKHHNQSPCKYYNHITRPSLNRYPSALFCTQPTTTTTQTAPSEQENKDEKDDDKGSGKSWYPDDDESDKAKNNSFRKRWALYSIGALTAFLTYKICKSPQQYTSLPDDISDQPLSFRSYLFSNILANRALSRICAPLTEKTIPISLRKYIYSSVGLIWNVDWNEFKQDLTQYTTFKQFFIRPLEYPRTLSGSDLISPSDGRVLTFGQIDEKNGTLEQIKGVRFKLQQFLYGYDSKEMHPNMIDLSNGKSNGNSLYYCIIYLCPGMDGVL